MTAVAAQDLGPPMDETWRKVLAGDKDAYRHLAEPHLAELIRAAARELRYRRAVGDLRPQDLAADELVGETLTRGWRDRARRPATLGVRPWLLGLEFKVLEAIVRSERRARRLAGVSLEAPVDDEAARVDATEEEFWEWFQPDDITRWEDVIPTDGLAPEDLSDGKTYRLTNEERQALVLSVEHRLSVVEISSVMNLAPERTVRLINTAQRQLGDT